MLKRLVFGVEMMLALLLVMIPNSISQAKIKGKLNRTTATVMIGKSVRLKVKEKGDAWLKWSSSNRKVAKVSSMGKVLGKGKGNATITARLSKGGRTRKLKCKVLVIKPAKDIEIINKKAKKVKNLIMNKFESVPLYAKILPKSSNDVVTWKSSDSDVVSVRDGCITGEYVGTATITAQTHSGKKVKVKVTVKAPELKDSLKEAYKNDFHIGVAINTWQMEGAGALAKAKDLISSQFSSITMENQMKPEHLMRKDTIVKGSDTDVLLNEALLHKILSLAKENGVKMRGHTMIWHNQTPEWFFHEDYDVQKNYVSKEVLRQRMKSYIKNLLTFCQTNYPGQIYAWDVANEVVTDEGDMRTKTNWYKIYGDDSYIMDAFVFARKYADPGVKLFLNDYNEYNTAKRDKIYSVLKKLYEAGVCDGIGMQSHYVIDYPTMAQVKVAIKKYNQIDPGKIEVQLTELDIHCTERKAEGQKILAERTRELFEMLLDCRRNQNINITGVTFWGLTDEDTWLTDFRKETSYPALFGGDYAAKSAYFAVLEAAKE